MNKYSLRSDQCLYQNSSGGMLLKWKVENKYIKTSTLDASSLQTKFMYESYGEVIVSKILSILGIEHVTYRLCEVEIDRSMRTIACESVDFKPMGYRDISFGKLMLSGKIPKLDYNNLENYYTLIEVASKCGVDIREYLNNIILIDGITLNDDRHYGNFGLMINPTSKRVKAQPIFDTGNGLFCHKHIEGLQYSDDLMQYLRCKPFSLNFNAQLSLIGKDIFKHKDRLLEIERRIPGILFSMVSKGLPAERANFIVDLISSRVHYLTKIEC